MWFIQPILDAIKKLEKAQEQTNEKLDAIIKLLTPPPVTGIEAVENPPTVRT